MLVTEVCLTRRGRRVIGIETRGHGAVEDVMKLAVPVEMMEASECVAEVVAALVMALSSPSELLRMKTPTTEVRPS